MLQFIENLIFLKNFISIYLLKLKCLIVFLYKFSFISVFKYWGLEKSTIILFKTRYKWIKSNCDFQENILLCEYWVTSFCSSGFKLNFANIVLHFFQNFVHWSTKRFFCKTVFDYWGVYIHIFEFCFVKSISDMYKTIFIN